MSARNRFRIDLLDVGGASPDAYRRLAGLLKAALRRFEFRALSVSEAEGDPSDRRPLRACCSGGLSFDPPYPYPAPPTTVTVPVRSPSVPVKEVCRDERSLAEER
jgi:hypothetical protein